MLFLLQRQLRPTARKYSGKHLIVGIRREAKNRWERRVPLTPEHVERLAKLGVKVYVQPSSKRVFPDAKYAEAGAVIHEDLAVADIILGVKEVPNAQLIPHKTYLFFSHTHKGQPYNMALLKASMEKKITLVDYELITNSEGRRLVQFSRFAGYAGMVDGLHVLGHRLLALGYGNPMLAIGMSYMYRCLADARLDVTRTGQVIIDEGLPKELGPIIFVIVGDGNVSRGALQVFKCLPHEWVTSGELAALSSSTSFDNHKIYICQVKAEDYIVANDGGPFQSDRYYSNPEEFKSIFHEKIAPFARFILNGIFWTEKYPRLMTIEQTEHLQRSNRLKLLTLADVSCDIGGSFEFVGKASTIDQPWFMWDPIKKIAHQGELISVIIDVEARGIQIMSIDNLPTEMPLEASQYFSDALFPIVFEMTKGSPNIPVIERATIVKEGELTPKHKHLQKIIDSVVVSKAQPVHQKILILGSGFVVKPALDYLLRNGRNIVTIATNNLKEAASITEKRMNAPIVDLDVSDSVKLASLVASNDIVLSFLPASMHSIIVPHCIRLRKHLITASYISSVMRAFDSEAREAGVLLLNEIGLDPGLDHLTACQVFDEVKSGGGIIKSFTSWCGGLPAPEISNNPLGYKFSWSPRGVLLAGLNGAEFKRDKKIFRIEPGTLLSHAVDVPIFKGFAFEGLANRNSLQYVDEYQLGNLMDVDTMFRGTLRYKGYSELMNAFVRLGFMDDLKKIRGKSWAELSKEIAHGYLDKTLFNSKIGTVESGTYERTMEAMKWLGMNDKNLEVDSKSTTALDAFCSLLQDKLVYLPGERDMVAMHHEFGIMWGDGRAEKRTSTLIEYGDPKGYSAMSKTVGLPAAIAVDLVLDGTITMRGVCAPTDSLIYEPILAKLAKEGIRFTETIL